MIKVEVPDILKEFSDELIAKQRQVISVTAKPLDCAINFDPLDLKQSKFLGTPFVPEGSIYPMDKSGNPLIMLAQLNFAEIPNLPGFPVEGILQLYVSSTEWWDSSGAEKIVFLTGAEILKPPMEQVPSISLESYEELPIWKVHSLEFNHTIDTGNSEDCQFSVNFGGKDYWDFEESLSEAEKKIFEEYFSPKGHKIGGYADFTQSDPRDYKDSNKNDLQLLQIDTDDEIMFGDCGIGHIFISPEHLAAENLERAYFYWDCC